MATLNGNGEPTIWWVDVSTTYKVWADTAEEARELIETFPDGNYDAGVKVKDQNWEYTLDNAPITYADRK